MALLRTRLMILFKDNKNKYFSISQHFMLSILITNNLDELVKNYNCTNLTISHL